MKGMWLIFWHFHRGLIVVSGGGVAVSKSDSFITLLFFLLNHFMIFTLTS